jgi:HD-like signal output (HDOD) protein
MSPQHPELEASIQRALERVRELPPVPAVAVEVLHVTRKKDASTADLAAAISLDPAISARLLKLVNSALLGRSCKIASVKRVCAHLGFQTTKCWVLGLLVAYAFECSYVEEFDYDRFWRGSALRAVGAKLFADAAAPCIADEAFVSGLLSQIGRLALANYLASDYRAVREASGESWPPAEAEREILAYSSEDLSLALLHSWGLPSVIYEALFAAQHPETISEVSSQPTQQLALVLALAWRCDGLIEGSNKAQALADLLEAANDSFHMRSASVLHVLSKIDRHMLEMADILQIRLSGPDMATVVSEAQLDLSPATGSDLRPTPA